MGKWINVAFISLYVNGRLVFANTQTGTFVDLNSSDIIAYGELSDAEASRTDMKEYEKFEIDIKYRNLTTEPHLYFNCSFC